MGGTARTSPSAGENLVHFNAIRYRVQGSGKLKTTFISQDDVYSQPLAELSLLTATNRQPTLLSNFIQQRALFRVGTTEMNEWFRINRIIVFSREIYSSYPQ